MRTLAALLMLALLSIAPLALAQDDNSSSKDGSGGEIGSPENTPDCSPEGPCLYGGSDGSDGGDPCIYCSEGPTDTCMDGQQANETCDPNVYYMDAPTRGPEDGSCVNCRGPVTEDSSHAPAIDTAGDQAKAVPGPAVAVGILAAAGAALLLLPRRG